MPDVFKEIDRLAYVIRAIESDCSIVPCGAFKITPTHELRYDENFHGLELAGICRMENWQHFRQPTDIEVMKDISNQIFWKTKNRSERWSLIPNKIFGPTWKWFAKRMLDCSKRFFKIQCILLKWLANKNRLHWKMVIGQGL